MTTTLTLIRRSIKTSLWTASHPLQESAVGCAILRFLRSTAFAWRNFWKDEILIRATALAYSTMLSIVPLLAVAFSLFKAFPGLRGAYYQLRGMIFQSLAPGTSEVVVQALDSFILNIQEGAVAGIGTAGLFVTALLLLSSIDSAFNTIFQVTKTRNLFDRIVYYLAFILAGPVLVGLSLRTIPSTFIQQFSRLRIPEQDFLTAVWDGFLLPYLSAVVAFTALYVVIPNVKIRWSAGIAGGLVTGTLFELAKRSYTWYATSSDSYTGIYGAIGAIPVFIVWIYLIWVVVLFGAEITYAWQNVDAYHRRLIHRDAGQAFREWVAATFTVEATRAFFDGKPGPTVDTFHAKYDVPDDMTRRILERLTETAILTESERGYLPARNPETISLADIVAALRNGPLAEESEMSHLRTDSPAVTATLTRLEQESYDEYRKVTLADLARETAPAAEAPSGNGTGSK